MTARRFLWIVLAVVLVTVAILLAPGDGAASSSLSRGADGWWAVRAYLDARGTETRRIDRPLAELDDSDRPGERGRRGQRDALGDGTLVLALPWQKAFVGDDGRAVADQLRAGGTVVLGYAYDRFGRAAAPRLWTTLGIQDTADLRPEPPLAPWDWWSYRQERWALRPAAGHPAPGTPRSLPTIEIRAFDTAPVAPPEADVLYAVEADPEGDGEARSVPLVFTYERLGGRVVVLPSALFSNAELRRAGNADLAESLRRGLAGPWRFDEYHHGVLAPELRERESTVYAWDLFVWHLGLVYVLGVWALARRFGPAWREPVRRHGSTAAFLRSLGGLHHRLGHHRDAARLLVRRAHELEPRGAEELESFRRRAEAVADGEDLVRLARRIR